MKLVRYGAAGSEKPGMIDADGKIRDLSAHVAEIGGKALSPDQLARLAEIDPNSLPLVNGNPRSRPKPQPARGHADRRRKQSLSDVKEPQRSRTVEEL